MTNPLQSLEEALHYIATLEARAKDDAAILEAVKAAEPQFRAIADAVDAAKPAFEKIIAAVEKRTSDN